MTQQVLLRGPMLRYVILNIVFERGVPQPVSPHVRDTVIATGFFDDFDGEERQARLSKRDEARANLRQAQQEADEAEEGVSVLQDPAPTTSREPVTRRASATDVNPIDTGEDTKPDKVTNIPQFRGPGARQKALDHAAEEFDVALSTDGLLKDLNAGIVALYKGASFEEIEGATSLEEVEEGDDGTGGEAGDETIPPEGTEGALAV